MISRHLRRASLRLLAMALVACSLAPIGPARSQVVPQRIAAIVNDDVITTQDLVDRLKDRVDTVVVFDDPRLEQFDPVCYAELLVALIGERAPLVTLLGHTPWSLDLAPALAVRTGYPLATDCVDIVLDGGRPKVIRQIYSGRLFARMAFREAAGYLITVRAGSFPAAESGERRAADVRPPHSAPSGTVTREVLG